MGAKKSERNNSRSGYRCDYRPRRLDTRMGTMYLMVPKVWQGDYIPFFVTERKRSEAALIQVMQEVFVHKWMLSAIDLFRKNTIREYTA